MRKHLKLWAAGITVFVVLFNVSSALAGSPDCATSLRELIEIHDFQNAYICAEKRLETDPKDADAMLVIARAAQELGQFELAGEFARSARNLDLDVGQNFAAYLISGLSAATNQKFVSAKLYLRRASDFARHDSERALVRQSLSQIAARSPWHLGFGLGIVPSTNINSGSKHDTIEFAGLEFTLDDDARAQAGVIFSLSAEATHRKTVFARTIWENTLSLNSTIHDGRGRNNSQARLATGVRFAPDTTAPSLVYGYLALDKLFVADDSGGPVIAPHTPYYTQTVAGLEYHAESGSHSAWNIYATHTNRISDISANQHAQIIKVGAGYTQDVIETFTFGLEGYLQNTSSEAVDTAGDSASLTAKLSYSPTSLPIKFTGTIGYTHTEFEHQLFGYPAARVDDDISVEMAVTHENVQFYGFNPTFGITLTRDFSNLARYDMESVQAFTRLSSAF